MQNKYRFFVAMALGLAVFASAAPASAQLPQPLWSVTYGEPGYSGWAYKNDWVSGAFPLSSGGFAAFGQNSTFDLNGNPMSGFSPTGFMMIYDQFGNLKKNFSIGNFGFLPASTGNDEFLTSGASFDGISGTRGRLEKINTDGQILWAKKVDTTILNFQGDIVLTALSPSTDGNTVVFLRHQKWPGYPKDENDRTIFLKFNSDGEIVAQMNYSLTLYYPSISSSADGGIFAASDRLTAKFDSQGTMQWQKSYSVPLSVNSTFQWALALPQGGFLVGGSVYNQNYSRHGIILRLGEDGEIIWSRDLFLTGSDWVNSLSLVENGILVAGYSTGSSQTLDPWIAKFDLQGDFLSTKDYASFSNSQRWLYPMNLTPLANSSTLLASARVTSVDNAYDAWLAKIDSNGNIGGSCAVTDIQMTVTVITPTVSNFGFTEPLTSTLIYTDVNESVGAPLPFVKTSECRSGLACQLYLPTTLRDTNSSW